MTVPAPDDLIQAKLLELLQEQPWWKRSANTVTGAVSGLAVLAWWLTSTGIDFPDQVTYGIGVVLFAASVLGIKRTPNGLTPALVEQLTGQLGATVATYKGNPQAKE